MTATASALEQLRIELLLALPDLGVNVPAGLTAPRLLVEIKPGHAAPPTGDQDYNRDQLVAWLLARVSSLVQTEAVALAASDVDELEATQSRTIELSAAAATFSALAEWLQYLSQLAPILRGGLSIKDSTDLAATLDVERARVSEILAALAARFPALTDLLGDAVGARGRGLVNAAGVPLG